jgi:hypothetical protein
MPRIRHAPEGDPSFDGLRVHAKVVGDVAGCQAGRVERVSEPIIRHVASTSRDVFTIAETSLEVRACGDVVPAMSRP